MNRRNLLATLVFVAVLVVSGCSSVIDTQVAAAPAAVKQQVHLQFASHLQMGMAEQDVYVEIDEGKVRRIVADEIEQFSEARVYGTALAVHHDPFGLDDSTMQPKEMGVDLGFTFGEWLAASGAGTYTVSGEHAELDLSFERLVPNGVYTLWCSTSSAPPAFRIVDIACGNPYGTNNTVIADGQGSARVRLVTATMPEAGEGYLPVIALAYHSDGQTYGEYAGDFGLNSHVQLVTLIPSPDDSVWQEIE